jgi:hypothetical protein
MVGVLAKLSPRAPGKRPAAKMGHTATVVRSTRAQITPAHARVHPRSSDATVIPREYVPRSELPRVRRWVPAHELRRRSAGAKQDSCVVSWPAFDEPGRRGSPRPHHVPLTLFKQIAFCRYLTETSLPVPAGGREEAIGAAA